MQPSQPLSTTYRIATWNTQGSKWDDITSLLSQKVEGDPVDIICIQEAGGIPDRYVQTKSVSPDGTAYWTGVVNIATSSRPLTFNAVWVEWGDGNDRCSLAILSKYENGASPVQIVPAASDKLRPAVGLQVAPGVVVYCIHSPSSGGAAGVSAQILDAISSKHHVAWACLGDFNCEPSQLSLKLKAGLVVKSPQQPTQQGGRILDYGVASGGTLQLVDSTTRKASDHFSQFFVWTAP